MNNESSESGTDISLDFNKEIKHNSNNNKSNFLSNNDVQINKSGKKEDIIKSIKKNEEIKISKDIVGTPNLLMNEENEDTVGSLQNNILINNMNVNIKNYRMDNFKNLRNKFEKISETTKNQKSLDFDRIFKNSNKEKNNNVINQINSLLVNIDNLKTKSTNFNPDVKDSLLNSYKDWVIVKENNRFAEGVPILELKKEQFLKNTKIKEVKL